MKVALLFALLVSSFLFGANECVKCHKGIENIRQSDSEMMKAIFEVANKAGHKGNDCIVCHGGNPQTNNKNLAHKGTPNYFQTHKGPKAYYAKPASPQVNQNTCGSCHPTQVASQKNSLMLSQTGEIQGALWSVGAKEGYKHIYANYKTKNPDDNSTRVGSDSYKEYMQKLTDSEPQAFPNETQALRKAPTPAEIQKEPSLAIYTYLRQKKLANATHEFQGKGCASCHIPFSEKGYYKGNDKSISKREKGHILTHQIQSSRKVTVSVDDINYSGVPVGTCASCHNEGKSIGASYQGLMESEPYAQGKEFQHSMHMREDIHYKKGMLCQDCHTSNDLHGDGFLRGAKTAAVEIECQDCHGTTKAYPWELPLGYSDEFNTTRERGEPRGVAQTLSKYLEQGYVPEKKDGYILSARGNPLVKAVKVGNEILLHLSSGKDVMLQPLKLLKMQRALSQKALVAMDMIGAHTKNMECYSCHATWAPQYYGNNITIDYSQGKKNIDYLQASQENSLGRKDLKKYLVAGEVSQRVEYIRWEEPALVQNGEGRISPVVPQNQMSFTVIGKDAKAVVQNYIYKIPELEGATQKGQNAISMSPIQPHTITKEVRSCESCHASPKALGLGIDANLKYDYSKFVDENGSQLMSVGHHFKLAQALDKMQREKLDRRGVCISCHQEIPKGNLAISTMNHIAQMAEVRMDNKEHKSIMNRVLNISAWFQTLAIVFALLVFIYVMYTVFIKKKIINPRNKGWK